MKGKSLLFGLCLCLWTSLGWGQRVIEVPWYETTNTYMFDIIKMELTDEATIITGQVKYFPNEWFRVVGRTVLRGESGKEYKLLKAEGIKLNEQVFLPESGQMTFQLYFEPVDAGEKKVDYVEGNHETDWRIGGIVLDEKPQKVNYSVRPAGMYLIAYHKGKWQTLEDTYKKILEYGKENKIQLGAHCYEDILFDSLTMSEEEEYLTRIVFEIQSSKSGK